MRVLHVIPSLGSRTGGPAVAAVEFACALESQGIESAVFATDMAYPAQTRRSVHVDAAELPPHADEVAVRLFPAQLPYRLAYSPALGRALRAEVAGYDAVHIHSLYLYPQFAAARAAARFRVPFVVSPHGALDPWLRRRGRVQKTLAELVWQRRMLDRAAALHFTSDEEARLAGRVAPNVQRAIVPLGIRSSEYAELPSPETFRARYLGGTTAPLVLTLGRLAQKKGLDILVRAFALLAREHRDARLVIAGPDDEGIQEGLAALAERDGVADRVVFPGMLEGETKLAALAAADVWALPSHTENFGIAVMEALAAGAPTVISPAVNLAAAVERADAGLVAVAEPKAFAAAISSLLDDSERRAAYGRRAREFARQYDWEALAPRIVQLYEGIAGRRTEAAVGAPA